MDNYIYRTKMRGIDYLCVRVPRIIGEERGYWKVRYYSLSRHTLEEALVLARGYRDECVLKNDRMPTGYGADLEDEDWNQRMRDLCAFKVKYGSIHISTICMVGMFVYNCLSVNDLAEYLDVEVMNIRRQVCNLEDKGFIKHDVHYKGVHSRKYFLISGKGEGMLREFRRCVSGREGMLYSMEEYLEMFFVFKGLLLTINEVLVLLFISRGITNQALIVRIVGREISGISSTFTSLLTRGLIEDSSYFGIKLSSRGVLVIRLLEIK